MAIEVIAEEVAANLEEVAEATRQLNTVGLGYLGGGLVIGAAVGFFFGYKMSKNKIKAQALQDADDQIEDMRVYFEQRAMAAVEKPALEDVVAEHGYSTTTVIVDRPARPLPAPVPVSEAIASNDFVDQKVDYSKVSMAETREDVGIPAAVKESVPLSELPNYPPWDYARELDKRTPDKPYVISADEFVNSELGYQQEELTYYAVDDVLSGEDNRPLMIAQEVVGLENLKWGYGSADPHVVYVRNDRLETDMLLRRLDASYEVEVMGLDDADTP